MTTTKLADFDDERVKALLVRHLEGMHANSPPGHVFALDWSGLQQPEVTLYTLWDDEELLGFGALKELDAMSGEVKSMRTADSHLRKGVAAMIDGGAFGPYLKSEFNQFLHLDLAVDSPAVHRPDNR